MPPAGTTELSGLAETLEALYESCDRETDLFIDPWNEIFKPSAKEILEALDAGKLTRPQLEKYILALNIAFCSISKRYGLLRLTLGHLADYLSDHLRHGVEDALEDEELEAIRVKGRQVDWDATKKMDRDAVLGRLEESLRLERRKSGVAEEEVQLFRDMLKEVLDRGGRLYKAQRRIDREQRALDAERVEVTAAVRGVLGAHMNFRGGRTPAEMIYRLSKTIVQSVPVLPSAEEEKQEKQDEEKKKKKKGKRRRGLGRLPLFNAEVGRPVEKLSAVRRQGCSALPGLQPAEQPRRGRSLSLSLSGARRG
ncbi:hypothetical protein CSOJ01_12078 [Colletotrichum sojae]|uniref:Uncharacterized protein n=1 Tax=Colletotrichum sojae TaxID=2175907 RepID=A0A8H6MM27_9PEZI|nr:hypothetical protein CSOJ01_12078 [Colletotrichum sojae]